MRYVAGLGRTVAEALFSQADLVFIGVVATAALVGSRYIPEPAAAAVGSALRAVATSLAPRIPAQSWLRAGTYVCRGGLYLGLTLVSVPLLRRSLLELGWSLGRWRSWLIDIGLLYLVMLPLLLWASRQPSFQRVYPYFGIARCGASALAFCLVLRLFHMLGWEFLFRGYLLFGFERRVGGPVPRSSSRPFRSC